jgi:tetratricopeptide (TPR) repeat protein
LKEASYDEIRRIIREEQPAKPSTRISTLGQAATTISANRKSEPGRLSQLFRGELDWIVIKALEKDRNRRYDTASSFAADVQRYLHDEPVQACPPSAMYRFGKFAQRNRAALTTIAAIALAVLLGVIGLAVSTVLVWQETQKTKVAKLQTEAILKTAYEVLETNYMDVAERRLPLQEALTSEDRQFLEKALTFYEQLAQQQDNEPRVRQQTAWAYLRAANIQAQLGQDTEAKARYHQALARFEELVAEVPNDSPYRHKLARCLLDMADTVIHPLYFDTMEENEKALRRAIGLQERLVHDVPADSECRRDLAASYALLGIRLRQRRQLDESERFLRRALDIRDTLAEQHPTMPHYRQDLGDSLGRLGGVVADTGKIEEAEKLYRRGLAVRKKIVDDFPNLRLHRFYLGFAYAELGMVLQNIGRLQVAEENRRQAVATWRKSVDDFPSVPLCRLVYSDSLIDLAYVLQQMRRFEEGEQVYREAQAILKNLTRDHPAVALNRLGWRDQSNGLFPDGDHARIGVTVHR